MSELKDKGVSTKTNNQLSGISEDVARQLEREDDSEVIFLQTYADLSRRLTGTSPGTLQDVTMDTSYGVGYRSPCVGSQFYHGSTVSQGRSVREFEEQMSALRKENFNLKLRLYFLEENLPGYQQANKNQTEDTLMKQLVDHKVELEMLRKDLLDKQELLKDAADALAHMDNLAKNKSEDRDAEPQQTCSNSDEDSQEKKSTEEVLNKENLSVLQKICELEEMLANANEQINEFQNQITTLDDILIQRDDTIKEYEEKIKQLIFQNSELQETLETRDNEIHNAEMAAVSLQYSYNDLKNDNKSLTRALKATQDKYRKEVHNVKLCKLQLEDQLDLLTKLQEVISKRTNDTTCFLKQIYYYERVVSKFCEECKQTKQENVYLKSCIQKLEHDCRNVANKHMEQESINDLPTTSSNRLNSSHGVQETIKLSKNMYVQVSNGQSSAKSTESAVMSTLETSSCAEIEKLIDNCFREATVAMQKNNTSNGNFNTNNPMLHTHFSTASALQITKEAAKDILELFCFQSIGAKTEKAVSKKKKTKCISQMWKLSLKTFYCTVSIYARYLNMGFEYN